MRLRAAILVLAAVAGSAALSWHLAGRATDFVERETARRLEAALSDPVHDWVSIEVNGTLVTLTGAAPDETSRFRTVEIVRQVVDPERVREAVTIAAPDPRSAPEFVLEILRNGDEISLIGLAPAETVEARAIRAALANGRFDGQITNMLETASYPAPEGWEESLDYGLAVISGLPRAKVSVVPGRVAISAFADSDTARTALTDSLQAAVPEGVELELDIAAPRRVIMPFQLQYHFNGVSGSLVVCNAETEADAERIVAATRTDAESRVPCALGLGAPSADWPLVVEATMGLLHGLGGGSLVIADGDILLSGPIDAGAERLVEAEENLRAALPPEYSATITMTKPEGEAAGEPEYQPRFSAVLNAEGRVELSGVVRDAASRDAIHSYAIALFGHDRVSQNLVSDPALPEGWPGRVLAGLEALGEIQHGVLDVTGEELVLTGWSLTEDAQAQVSELLTSKVAGAVVDIVVDAQAAEAVARAERLATLSRPEACAEEIGAVLEAEAIEFSAGSANIEPSSQGIIAAIADILRQCPGTEFEVAGHTDAQGSADANLRLSEQRARAVRNAIEAHDVPLITLSATGYGAEQPVADNETEAGRRQNRRIELTLVRDLPVREESGETADAGDGETGCAARVAELLEDEPIQFGMGSAIIEPASLDTLVSVAQVLRTCPDSAFEVGGHTDNRGRITVNEALSLERAEAVATALGGLEAGGERLTAKGYGPSVPVAENDTEAGRSRNRRIELKLISEAVVAEDEDAAPGSDTDQAGLPEVFVRCEADIAAALAEGGIQFAPSAATIADDSAGVIERVAQVLKSCPGAAFEIGGHTDDSGSEAGNQRLSERRAEAVLEALTAQEPGDVTLSSRGYGEANPIADNSTRDGRARNRRIEITLVGGTMPPEVAESEEEAETPPEKCETDIAALLGEGGIQFAPESSTLTSESAIVIDQIAEMLKSCPNTAFEVGGHTDDIGSEGGNLALSERRAQSVLEALEARDLSAVTLSAKGYGEANPIADNDTRDGRARNRRIEMTLLDGGGPDVPPAEDAADSGDTQ